ncbi:MAG: protein kinase [Lentisphaerales bacterium]|nr:protein kinase [Lentisphaerales bacterium]
MVELNSNDLNMLSSLYTQLQEGDGELLEEHTILQELKDNARRYKNPELVGEGGFKKVYGAIDELTGRKVAMAMLADDSTTEEKERFLREARITACLQHPNIIPVYDMGLSEDDQVFFSMKLVEGESLATIFEKLYENNPDYSNKYPQEVLLDIFIKICEAIAYAHSKGILHLDLKPENIQISQFGEVLVCDWGLAIILGTCSDPLIERYSFDEFQKENMTLKGTIKGTPGFMAPEQIRGNMKDERTDIYALGAILYQMLYGQIPVKGDSVNKTIENTLAGQISEPTQKAASLHAVVMKALHMKSDQRYQKANDLLAEINKHRLGFATDAEEAGLTRVLYLLFNRNRLASILTFSFFVILGITVISFISRLKEEITKLEFERNAKETLQTQVLPKHYQDALSLYNQGKLPEAKQEVAKCLKLDQSYLPAKNLMGKILFISGDFEASKTYLTQPENIWDKVFANVQISDNALTTDQASQLIESCKKIKGLEALLLIKQQLLFHSDNIHQKSLSVLQNWKGRTEDCTELLETCQQLKEDERNQILQRVYILLRSKLNWTQRRSTARQALEICTDAELRENLQELNPKNLAWQVPVVGIGNTQERLPEATVDGKLEGFWGVKAPAMLVLDLTEKSDITKIQLHFLWKKKVRVYQYKISTSLDGVNYEELIDQSQNEKAASDEPFTFTFTPRKARYLRFNLVGGQPFDSVHIREIEVFE